MRKEQIRTFPLRVVLTVTTGRLLTSPKGPNDNGISDLYDILKHMTGDSPYTHQLGRFCDECWPWLLRWYPKLSLADGRIGELDRRIAVDRAGGIESWLSDVENDIGPSFDVGQIPHDDHDKIHPVEELVSIFNTGEENGR